MICKLNNYCIIGKLIILFHRVYSILFDGQIISESTVKSAVCDNLKKLFSVVCRQAFDRLQRIDDQQSAANDDNGNSLWSDIVPDIEDDTPNEDEKVVSITF